MPHLSIENARVSIARLRAGLSGNPSFDAWRHYAIGRWQALIRELTIS